MTKVALLLAAVIVAASAAGAFAHQAKASTTHASWTMTWSATAKCNTQTGKYDVTWTGNNGGESLPAVVQTSNRSAVSVGSQIAAHQSRDFSESLPGNTSGTTTLSVKVNWPGGDSTLNSFTASVTTSGTCTMTPPDTEKVTLCHATSSETNPYVKIDIDAAGAYNGHLDSVHGGAGSDSGDIIPPFVYQGHTYSQNWDANGQATWNNGCVPPGTPPTKVAGMITKVTKDVAGNVFPTPSGVFSYEVTCDDHKVTITYSGVPTAGPQCTIGSTVTCKETILVHPEDWVSLSPDTVTNTVTANGWVCNFLDQEKAPPQGNCPEGTVKIGDNPLTCLKTVTVYGHPNCPEGTTESQRGDGFVVCTKTITVYGNPTCPAGTTETSRGQGFVVCNTATNTTTTVYGNPTCPAGTNETSRGQGFVVCNTTTTTTVYGTPTCPAGTTQTSSGQGFVVCNTVKTITVTKTKVVVKKVVVKVKQKAKPKKKPAKHKHYTKPPKPYTP